MEMNWKTIAIGAASLVIIVGTNVGQYLVIWSPHDKAIETKYTQQVSTLQNTLKQIGPMAGIWVIKKGDTSIFPGKVITQDDLEIKNIPLSFVFQGYVLDPSEVVGKYFKVALSPGAPLLKELVMEEPLDDSVREFDVVATLLPIGLKVGDYTDFRLLYPLGEDYIVLSHKRVEGINGKTVKFQMNETEIHLYQAALVDYYIQSQKGSSIYLTKYLEPGSQKPAQAYYAVPKNILAIMTLDPNISQKISTAINNNTRGVIDAGIAAVPLDLGSAISAGRNDVKSQVDAGTNALEANEKKAADLLNQLGNTPAATDKSTTDSSTTTTGTTSTGSGTSGGTLNIGKGVTQ